ncbi:MAG: prolyl oligopeptidase family serine peptidase [Alphaproteobacteria bacterium]
MIVIALLLTSPSLAFAEEPKELEVHNFTLPAVPHIEYQEDDSGQEQHQVQFNGQARTYQLYAPEGAPDPRPAILLLHGGKRNGVSLVEKWKDIADKNNVILIGPTASGSLWSMETDSPEFLDAVIEDASRYYSIDPSRLYLFGHSSGGIQACYLVTRRSKKFAAAAVNAGMFLSYNDYSYVNRADRKIPMAFLTGTNDNIVPMDKVRATADVFAAGGHDTSLYIFDGHTHWYYDSASDINEKVWQFLSSYELQ